MDDNERIMAKFHQFNVIQPNASNIDYSEFTGIIPHMNADKPAKSTYQIQINEYLADYISEKTN
jgi:hypothetical protein